MYSNKAISGSRRLTPKHWNFASKFTWKAFFYLLEKQLESPWWNSVCWISLYTYHKMW